VILSQIKTEKIEPLVDVDDMGFLLSQPQSSFPEELHHQGFDFLYKEPMCCPCNDEVIRVANQMDFPAPQLSKTTIESVEGHVGCRG